MTNTRKIFAGAMVMIVTVVMIITSTTTYATDTTVPPDDEAAVAASRSDAFRWQDGSREMNAMAFSRAFIDSVKNLHIGTDRQRGLRTTNSSRRIVRETLVYDVSWGGIRAGFLIIETDPNQRDGVIRVASKAMTNNFVSAIYRVRDHAISWVDAQGLYPRFFEQHVREGARYRMDSYIVYDNRANKLHLSRNNSLQEFDTPQFTHDFLSMILYVRSMPLNAGDNFTINIFARPQTHSMRFRVHNRRETTRVGAGTFSTLRVEPTLVGDGRVFSRRDRMEVWVSDDENRYPVMIRSRIRVGSITARLIHVSR